MIRATGRARLAHARPVVDPGRQVGAPGPVDGSVEWPSPKRAGLAMMAHNTLMALTATAPPTGRA